MNIESLKIEKKEQIKLLKKEKSAKKIFVFEEASEKQIETHLKRIENGKNSQIRCG